MIAAGYPGLPAEVSPCLPAAALAQWQQLRPAEPGPAT